MLTKIETTPLSSSRLMAIATINSITLKPRTPWRRVVRCEVALSIVRSPTASGTSAGSPGRRCWRWLLLALAPADRDRDDPVVANDAPGGIAVRARQQTIDRGLPRCDVVSSNRARCTCLIEARGVVGHVVVAGDEADLVGAHPVQHVGGQHRRLRADVRFLVALQGRQLERGDAEQADGGQHQRDEHLDQGHAACARRDRAACAELRASSLVRMQAPGGGDLDRALIVADTNGVLDRERGVDCAVRRQSRACEANRGPVVRQQTDAVRYRIEALQNFVTGADDAGGARLIGEDEPAVAPVVCTGARLAHVRRRAGPGAHSHRHAAFDRFAAGDAERDHSSFVLATTRLSRIICENDGTPSENRMPRTARAAISSSRLKPCWLRVCMGAQPAQRCFRGQSHPTSGARAQTSGDAVDITTESSSHFGSGTRFT